MNAVGVGFLIVCGILCILSLVVLQMPPAQAGIFQNTPIWSSYHYRGHDYVIVKFGENIAVTHDESCTAR